MLLVLDNVEHILAGSTLLVEMLQRAPGVVLLVTSRERLNLQEEWIENQNTKVTNILLQGMAQKDRATPEQRVRWKENGNIYNSKISL